MLSVTLIKSKGYYVNLSAEDYYQKGGEPLGKWHGKGAAFLGLAGQIQEQEFSNVIDGFSPDGSRKLVQNAGEKNRQPGWDLTFSAAKTVSVVWSQADKTTRHKIQRAQEIAVQKALDWLESESVARRGKGGRIKESARLVIATFEHGTSRAQDPQLHTHTLIMNAAVREDSSTGAIESKQFYENKMTAGALYRAELAKQLEQQLGFEVTPAGKYQNLFELKGVDKALVAEFSKRREAIEKAMTASGHTSAKAAEIAALDTRQAKDHMPREALFKEWQQVGKAFHYQPPLIQRDRMRQHSVQQVEKIANALQAKALESLTYHHSTFTQKDLLRKLAESAPSTGLGVGDIQQITSNCLAGNAVVRLGRVAGERRYTTQEMLHIEQDLMQRVERSKTQERHAVSPRTIQKVCAAYPTLKPEQHNAIRHIMTQKGSIQVVEGWAGTGKTFMLNAARQAWEQSGYRVHGAALAAKAAGGLEEAGIKSQTLHRFLHQIETAQTTLTVKDVVVVDEAAMVGTRQLASLVKHVEAAKAKLILVGDSKQLQPIEAGGAFQQIGDRLGRAELMEITRQDLRWMRQAVKDMIAGKAEEVLEAYAKAGQLDVQENWQEAKVQLVTKWATEGGVTTPQENIILAGSNLDVYALNQQAQAARQAAGTLGENTLLLNNTQFREQDRILFTRNNRALGVKNGQLGTIERIQGKTLTVRLDTGRLDGGKHLQTGQEALKQIHTGKYDHIQLGYGMTTHKVQGDTRQKSFVLMGGSMQDRELSYVQLSRSKGKTYLFTDKLEAGDKLARLAKGMARSRQKGMAINQNMNQGMKKASKKTELTYG